MRYRLARNWLPKMVTENKCNHANTFSAATSPVLALSRNWLIFGVRINALNKKPRAIVAETTATSNPLSNSEKIVAILDVTKPNINKRGNKTRKYEATAFWDKTLNTAGATTTVNINMKPIFAACINKGKLKEASGISFTFDRFLIPKLQYFDFSV